MHDPFLRGAPKRCDLAHVEDRMDAAITVMPREFCQTSRIRLRTYEKNELPALQWRKEAERRHPCTSVPAADFPEQGAITLALHHCSSQIWRVGRSRSILSMAGTASLLEQLSSTRGQPGLIRDGIGSRRFSRRRRPTSIVLAKRISLPRNQGD
jgi:hypothetical protein